MKSLSLVFFLLFGTISLAQCDKVLVTGKVIDSIRPQSFYNLMIINQTTGKGVFGQPNGKFSVYASHGDSISLSITGYPIVSFRVNADGNCQHKGVYEVKGKVQEIEGVVVRPIKTLKQIKEEREALALRETRMVTGIEVMRSPLTALYQAFSKKEKAKRWIAKQEFKDNQEKVIKELLRTYVDGEIIELSEEEFDDFLHFLNMNTDFLKTASEMELIVFIKDKFEHYKNVKKSGISTYEDRIR